MPDRPPGSLRPILIDGLIFNDSTDQINFNRSIDVQRTHPNAKAFILLDCNNHVSSVLITVKISSIVI